MKNSGSVVANIVHSKVLSGDTCLKNVARESDRCKQVLPLPLYGLFPNTPVEFSSLGFQCTGISKRCYKEVFIWKEPPGLFYIINLGDVKNFLVYIIASYCEVVL